jgi:hypothetical protein
VPSWFGVHRPIEPASPEPDPLPSLPPPSISVGPHVPSARQKCEAHWLSIVQTEPPPPPHPTSAAMLHCNAKEANRDDMAGTLATVMWICQAFFCNATKSLLAVRQRSP